MASSDAAGAVAEGSIARRVNKLNDDLSAQKNINTSTISQLATAREKLQQVNVTLQDRNASISDLENAAKTKEATIKTLNEQIATLQDSTSAEIARLEKEKADAIAEKDTERQAAIQQEQQKKTQLQEKLDALQSDFQAKSTDLEQLQSQLDNQKRDLEARIQAAETKAAEDLKNAQTDSDRQKAQATEEAAKKAGELQEQIDAKTTELELLQSEKGSCNAKIANLTNQLEDARKKIDEQVKQLKSMNSSVKNTNAARQGVVGRIPPSINRMATLNTETPGVAVGGRKKTRKKKKKRNTTKRVVFKSKKQNKKTRIKKIKKMNRKPEKKLTRRRK